MTGRIRRFCTRGAILLSVIAVLLNTCFSFTAFAAGDYYSQKSNDPDALITARLYYEAAMHCLGNGDKRSVTMNVSVNRSANKTESDAMRNILNLNSNALYEDNKIGEMTSTLLELWNPGSGSNEDNLVWCYEIDSIDKFISEIMGITGETKDALVEDLICGKDDKGGILNLFAINDNYTSGSGQGTSKITPYDPFPASRTMGCRAKLREIDELTEKPSYTMPYKDSKPAAVSVAIADNAPQKFAEIMGERLGISGYNAMGANTKESMSYVVRSNILDQVCFKASASKNMTTTAPTTATEKQNVDLKYYDPHKKQVFYYSSKDLDKNRKVYIPLEQSMSNITMIDTIFNVSGLQREMSCGSLATSMSNDDMIKNLLDRENDAIIESCIGRSSQAIADIKKRIDEYKAQQADANEFINNANRIAGNPKSASAAQEIAIVENKYTSLSAGLDKKPLYDKAALDSVLQNVKKLAESDAADAATTKAINDGIAKIKEGIQTTSAEIAKAEKYVTEMEDTLRQESKSLKGSIWEQDEETKTVTCPGLANIQKQIAGILTIAPPKIDPNFSSSLDYTNPEGQEEPDNTLDNCWSAGGIFGWIICPLTEYLSDMLNNVYEWIADNFLEVDATLLNPNSDANPNADTVFNMWSTFRNIANIAFIILFLIVIFSQLTGLGIDNYGIKRILPRLIITAVLINLSFFICQIAVDISNILGVAMNNLFGDLASNVKNTATQQQGPTLSGGVTSGAGIVVIGVAIGALITSGPAVLLPLILVLLVAAISALFMLIVLGVRQAGVIIGIIISPLAFAAYMLPNTNKLFKKWVDLLKGLLIVYPLCGILVGGSAFVAKLLYNTVGSTDTTGFVSMVVILLKVVPYFFLPTLFKSTLKGLGNLGATISSMGSRLGRSASGRTRNSGIYKGLQSRSKDWAAQKRSGVKVDSKTGEAHLTKFGRLRSRVPIGRRQLAADRTAALQAGATIARAKKLSSDEFFEATIARQKMEAEDDALKSEEAKIVNSSEFNSISALQTGLEQALLDGKKDQIKAYQNVLSAKGDKGHTAVRQAMINAQRHGEVSDEARRTYASNIMQRWASDYKKDSRSIYDYAVANSEDGDPAARGGSARMADYAEAGRLNFDSLTQQQLANMDESQLMWYSDALTSGRLSPEQKQTLTSLAQSALNNPHIFGNLKESQKRILQRFSNNTGALQSLMDEQTTNAHRDNAQPQPFSTTDASGTQHNLNGYNIQFTDNQISNKTIQQDTNNPAHTIISFDYNGQNYRWNATTGNYMHSAPTPPPPPNP